jgi:hypothetical protein
VDAQKTVSTEIMTYAMMLIIDLNGVKAEHDNTKQSLDLDVPLVLPGVLVMTHSQVPS